MEFCREGAGARTGWMGVVVRDSVFCMGNNVAVGDKRGEGPILAHSIIPSFRKKAIAVVCFVGLPRMLSLLFGTRREARPASSSRTQP